MTVRIEEIENYLKEELKKKEMEIGDRLLLEGMLKYFKRQKDAFNLNWESFVSDLEEKIDEWSTKYPVTGFRYELKDSSSNMDSIKTVSLKITSDKENVAVWTVVAFREDSSVYFESIQEELEDVRVESLTKAKEYILNVFESDDFKFFKKEMEEFYNKK